MPTALCVPLTSILETALYVDDLEAAQRFYGDLLGLTLFAFTPRHNLYFQVGHQMLLIFDARDTTAESPAYPHHGSLGPGHVCFRVSIADQHAWEGRIRDSSVAIEKIIDWPHGGRSIYFRDPSGNLIELANAEMWGFRSPPAHP